jgi:isoquinoline 1-oxidoreductase subunit beta
LPDQWFTAASSRLLPRVDVPAKSNGTAQFTLDVTFPGMLVAVLQRPPLFGAAVKSFDATAAKAVPGVVGVVQVPRGVAVVGKSFWAAKKGRDGLKVDWDDAKAEKRSSAAIIAGYRKWWSSRASRRAGKAMSPARSRQR